MQASDFMTRDVVSVSSDTSVGDALRLLYTHDIRHLPVVDDGHLTGILSERDLHGFFLEVTALEAIAANAARAADTPVSDLMSGAPLTVHAEVGHAEVIDIFLEHKIGAIPVVDPTSDTLVGIVSYLDVLRALRD